jgi:hypothetical protein
MRFRTYAGEFFDFPAIDVDEVHDEGATVIVAYGMSPNAEHAASMQCLGFFEALLEMAGATGVDARFAERCWEGTSKASLLALSWTHPEHRYWEPDWLARSPGPSREPAVKGAKLAE